VLHLWCLGVVPVLYCCDAVRAVRLLVLGAVMVSALCCAETVLARSSHKESMDGHQLSISSTTSQQHSSARCCVELDLCIPQQVIAPVKQHVCR
jgi:hypothetical protein